jgi:hypothetical protein
MLHRGVENEKSWRRSYHTELVRFPRTLLQMEMSILHSVIKAWSNGANAVVKLPADVAL